MDWCTGRTLHAVGEQIVERLAAARLLQAVDAAVAVVVEHDDDELLVEQERGRDLLAFAGRHPYLALALGFLSVILGTLNVVGGFVVTDRMLEMFKAKQPGREKGKES